MLWHNEWTNSLLSCVHLKCMQVKPEVQFIREKQIDELEQTSLWSTLVREDIIPYSARPTWSETDLSIWVIGFTH